MLRNLLITGCIIYCLISCIKIYLNINWEFLEYNITTTCFPLGIFVLQNHLGLQCKGIDLLPLNNSLLFPVSQEHPTSLFFTLYKPTLCFALRCSFSPWGTFSFPSLIIWHLELLELSHWSTWLSNIILILIYWVHFNPYLDSHVNRLPATFALLFFSIFLFPIINSTYYINQQYSFSSFFCCCVSLINPDIFHIRTAY